MRVLILVENVFATVGGGQSFYANLIEKNPQHTFYYFSSNIYLEKKLFQNVHVFQIGDYYRRFAGNINIEQFLISGYTIKSKEYDLLYLLDLASSAAGYEFDIIDIPDFQPLGAAFPAALQQVGVNFSRVAVSMHGTLTAGMTDNWADIIPQADLHLLDHAEKALYINSDIKYGISRRYLRDWQNKTGVVGNLLDLSTLFPYKYFETQRESIEQKILDYKNDIGENATEDRSINFSSREKDTDKPSLVFIGRQEKFKGPHLFVDIVAGLPRNSYNSAIMIGPEVNLGGVNSWEEIQKAAKHRGVVIERYELGQKTLWDKMARSRWISVIPSYKDTLNLVALESLMAGIPTAISSIAGICDYLDDVFPNIPYTQINPSDLIEARHKILNILSDYDNHQASLLLYLKQTSSLQCGLTIDEIYSHIDHERNSNKLLNLFEPVIKHVHDYAVSQTRNSIRQNIFDNLKSTFSDYSKDENISEFVRQLVHSYDQAYELRHYYKEILEKSKKQKFLDDAEMEDVWRHLLPNCFSNNRIFVYNLMATLEKERGNDLIYATYMIRCFRLGGLVSDDILEDVVQILNREGFKEEGQIAKWMFQQSPDHNSMFNYIENNGKRFFTPPEKNTEIEFDFRSNNFPKVAIIVSLYNAASKLAVFFDGLSNLTEKTKSSLEVIFIDSCSKDNTTETIKNLHEKYKKNGWHINLYYMKTFTRETIQHAWNRGIIASKSSYLSFLGVDEMNRADAYDILVDYLDNNPGVDWVQGNALVTEVNELGSFQNDLMLYNREFNSDIMQIFDTCYIGYVGALYRRAIHDRVGFYDSRFRGAGDSEFKNRSLPFISIVTLPYVLGYFLNYPEERTTQSPNAEIEDLRAWYLYRTPAGVAYILGTDSNDEIIKTFQKCFNYRKSYMNPKCTDIELASSISHFMFNKRYEIISSLFDLTVSVSGVKKSYQMLDSMNITLSKLSDIKFLHDCGGMIQQIAGVISNNIKNDPCDGKRISFNFSNDNRSHQHHNLWRSQSKIIRLEPPIQFADLAGPQDLGELFSSCQSDDSHVDFEKAWETNSVSQLKQLFSENVLDIAVECDTETVKSIYDYLSSHSHALSDANYTFIGLNMGALGNWPRVYITGRVNNPRPIIAAAKVVIVTDKAASISTAQARLMRAVSMGKAIITSKKIISSIQNRLSYFDTDAICVADSDQNAFEMAREIIADDNRRQNMEENCRNLAINLKNDKNVVCSWVSSYEVRHSADKLQNFLQYNRKIRDVFAENGANAVLSYISTIIENKDFAREIAHSIFVRRDAAILKTKQKAFELIKLKDNNLII